jgi:hypothetical protein
MLLDSAAAGALGWRVGVLFSRSMARRTLRRRLARDRTAWLSFLPSARLRWLVIDIGSMTSTWAGWQVRTADLFDGERSAGGHTMGAMHAVT